MGHIRSCEKAKDKRVGAAPHHPECLFAKQSVAKRDASFAFRLGWLCVLRFRWRVTRRTLARPIFRKHEWRAHNWLVPRDIVWRLDTQSQDCAKCWRSGDFHCQEKFLESKRHVDRVRWLRRIASRRKTARPGLPGR